MSLVKLHFCFLVFLKSIISFICQPSIVGVSTEKNSIQNIYTVISYARTRTAEAAFNRRETGQTSVPLSDLRDWRYGGINSTYVSPINDLPHPR